MAALDFGLRKRPLGGKAARSAREILLAVLPAQQQEIASGLHRTLVVDPIQAHSEPPLPGIEDALRAALEGPHPVKLLYQALDAEAPSERVVRPYGMAYRGTAHATAARLRCWTRLSCGKLCWRWGMESWPVTIGCVHR